MSKYIIGVTIKRKKQFGGGFVIEEVKEYRKEAASKTAAIREAREIGKAGLFSVTKMRASVSAPYYAAIEVLDESGEVVNRVNGYATDYNNVKESEADCTPDAAIAELVARGFGAESCSQ